MKPTIIIDKDVHAKVMHWVNKSNFEVSGLGTLIVEKPGVLRVVSAMLLPQKNTTTHTEIDAAAVAKAMYALRDAPGTLNWWWHSHVDMGVFWSKTDTDTIKELGEQGWIIATVFNKKNEKRSASYAKGALLQPWDPEKKDVFYDELVTEIDKQIHPSTPEWDKEYDDNVKTGHFFPQASTQAPVATGTASTSGGVGKAGKTVTGTVTPEPQPFWVKYTPVQLRQAMEADSAAKRPKEMAKSHWSMLRRCGKKVQGELLDKAMKYHGVSQQELNLEFATQPEKDAFGYTKLDWETLDIAEWCRREVTNAIEIYGFSASEVLDCARAEITPEEVSHYIARGWTTAGVASAAAKLAEVQQ